MTVAGVKRERGAGGPTLELNLNSSCGSRCVKSVPCVIRKT